MTTIAARPAADLLTWDSYMAEPEVEGRYDIINGVRIFMPGATLRHQRIAGNLARAIYRFEQASGVGITAFAPLDVLIRRVPKLQTRQPDVLFVSHARLAQAGGAPDVGPLTAAPELVVEIISNSETQRILAGKIDDYIAIGVEEVWVVRPEARTVETLRLTPDGPQRIAEHSEGQTITSSVLPDLAVPVADVFVA